MAKILLVEDDKSLREIYGVRLLAEGYDIVSAGDGEEALAMAIKEKPELIISDVMMPKISGFDMLDILRSTTETRDIKVIMMTALSSDDQRIRGEQLGADRYLVKSQVGIEDVVRTVHEVLGDNGSVAVPAAAAVATAVTPTEDAKPAEESTPTPVVEPTPVLDVPVPNPSTESSSTDNPDSIVASGSAPGNDSAGPLPPQPGEQLTATPVVPESTLPQPTAPFSSPRPTNLGESALHPTETPEVSAPVVATVADVSSQINAELQATAPAAVEPVEASTPAADPLVTPTVGENAETGLGLNLESSAPADDSASVPVAEAPVADAPANDSSRVDSDSEGEAPASPNTPSQAA